MSRKSTIEPWKKVCELRKEIRERQMKEDDFAVDLFRIVQRPPGKQPFYCDPDQFFATTYATENLRKFCTGLLRQLAGEPDGVSLINIAQTFGGGKSHSLATAYYLTGQQKPTRKHAAVAEILADAKMETPPSARVAAVSFDKVDWKGGGEVKAPDGEVRSFRMPWNLIAWQLLGQRGIDLLQRDEDEPDYYEPPAESLWMKLIAEVEKEGVGALILLDEFLMWAHGAASPDPDSERQDKGPVWFDRLKNFFQYLSQAVSAGDRSCMVISLLATDPAKNDEVGKEILARCNAGLNRKADVQTPVDKGDFAELLRRRMFEKFPKGAAECDKYVTTFWHRMQDIDPARAKMPTSKKVLMDAYPFHPDLLSRLFGKWAGLRQFQRTRGILQTFSAALRDAEAWDESPIISTQVFLAKPGATDQLSPAMEKMANSAMSSVEDANKPDWPSNLRTEYPRALTAQGGTTLMGREVEAACAAAFIYSQPMGEQAELGELRWLVGATVEFPAMLNTGLLDWARSSWYLCECESTDPASGLPRYWRLGPKPNLNQMHDAYKRSALKNARARYNELVKKCTPLTDGCTAYHVSFHLLSDNADKVKDDATFRLVILGAEYSGVPGNAPRSETVDIIRTKSSGGDPRTHQNLVLLVTPSETGLLQAEQAIASWLAWGDIKTSDAFKDLENEQKEAVKRRERESQKEALTAVKNAFELVVYVDKTGSIQQRKFTMGSEALFPTLLRDKELRIYDKKINPENLLPGHPSSKWPAGSPSVAVKDLYGAFGRYPELPKLLNSQAIVNTVEEAVQRGLLALRYIRPGGGEEWFWRSPIDGIMNWADHAEVWLPDQATLGQVRAEAVTPDALAGLWPAGEEPLKLSELCAWFDGAHAFDEIIQTGYPPEKRAVPKADYKEVHQAVAQAVERSCVWLVFGNDSLLGEKPSDLQLDPEATLLRPPEPLRAIDLLPGALSKAWSGTPPKTTLNALYTELKAQRKRPWPTKPFIAIINEALNQGILAESGPGGECASLAADGEREILLPEKTGTPAPTPSKPGMRESTESTLDLAELQNFVEDTAPVLTKLLAGASPEFAVRIKLKGEAATDLTAATEELKKINPDWKF